MKKYIITIVFALGFGINLNAQSDGFFASSYNEYRNDADEWGDIPALPSSYGFNDDVTAPLGNGLLLLGGLALAYGLRKKN